MGRKCYLVIGLGRFGMNVVKTLVKLNADVMACDINEERVQAAIEYTDQCLICDPTKKKVLVDICSHKIDHAIIAIGNNLQASMLATMNLKELGVEKITVRIDDSEYATIMQRLGATDVIIPEESSAIQLANEISNDSVLDFYEVKDDYVIITLKVSNLFPTTQLITLDARNKFDINIIGIIRGDLFILPHSRDYIKADDEVIVIGRKTNIDKFKKTLNSKKAEK